MPDISKKVSHSHTWFVHIYRQTDRYRTAWLKIQIMICNDDDKDLSKLENHRAHPDKLPLNKQFDLEHTREWVVLPNLRSSSNQFPSWSVLVDLACHMVQQPFQHSGHSHSRCIPNYRCWQNMVMVAPGHGSVSPHHFLASSWRCMVSDPCWSSCSTWLHLRSWVEWG